jgi:hypothetical protein
MTTTARLELPPLARRGGRCPPPVIEMIAQFLRWAFQPIFHPILVIVLLGCRRVS